MNQKILVADDQIEWYEKIKGYLKERSDISLLYVSEREKVIETAIQKSPSLILLDTMMSGTKSRPIYFQLKDNPSTKDIPIILFTKVFIAEEKVRETGAVDYIYKSSSLSSKEVVEKIERIVPPPIEIKIGNAIVKITNPFEISVEDADKISLEEFKKLFNLLKSKYKKIIEKGFEERRAIDIVLCNGEIVADSNIHGGLTEDIIKEIEREKGKICYIIGRGDFIEEIESCRWNITPIDNEDDAYPTVSIYLGRSEWDDDSKVFEKGIPICADFDTGNPLPPWGFLAFPDKVRKSLGEIRGIIGKSQHFQKDYIYNLKKVKIGIVDINKKSKCLNFNVRFVEDTDWWVLKQTDRSREGFVGRELMFRLKFSITLNPKSLDSTLRLL